MKSRFSRSREVEVVSTIYISEILIPTTSKWIEVDQRALLRAQIYSKNKETDDPAKNLKPNF